MSNVSACLRQLFLLFLFLWPLSTLLAQRADTIYSGSKVFIPANGSYKMYDTLMLRAKAAEEGMLRDSIRSRAAQQAFVATNGSVTVNANPCGVIAGFTPDQDLVIRSTPVVLTNTSTNATAVKWFRDGFYESADPTFTLYPGYAGLHEVKLVAINGSCTDTFRTWYFVPGDQPANRDEIQAYVGLPHTADYSRAMISVRGGGYLIAGYSEYYNRQNKPQQGLLMRLNEDGCVLWSRINDAIYRSDITSLAQTTDDNFAIFAVEGIRPYLMKMDANGNLLWCRMYRINDLPFYASKVVATDDNGMILIGQFGNEGVVVMRLDANGNEIWNKMFSKDTPGGWSWYGISDVMQKGNDVYAAGTVWQQGGNNPSSYFGYILKLDDATGNTTWSKKYTINGTDISVVNIISRGTDLIVNSSGGSGVPNSSSSIHVMDQDGNFNNSVSIGFSWNHSFHSSMIKATPSGDIYLLNTNTQPLNLQPYYARHSVAIRLDNMLQPVWAENYGSYGKGHFFFMDVGKNNTFAMLGDEIGMVVNYWTSFNYRMVFRKVKETGVDGWACSMNDVNLNMVSTPTVSQPFVWDSDQRMNIAVKDSLVMIPVVYGQIKFVCPSEFVDSCSFLKLEGKNDVCNLKKEYTYSIARNSACLQPVKWELPQGAIIVSQTNEEVTLKFTTMGEHWVKAELPFSCSPIKDSILVTASSSSLALNLGNDTIICENTAIPLTAATGFLRYAWQDGSTTPDFSVTAPGKYWVDAEDYCENVFTDTVYVTEAQLSIDLGPDLQKCNDESLVLKAPAGYLSYSWLTDYLISGLTGDEVKIQPAMDTSYILKAEQMPGCFAYDTIAVKVLRSPPVALGPDLQFCKGESHEISAGTGFASYKWNTGAVTEKIIINQEGEYSVIATSNNGCASYDTVLVPLIYPLPQPVLDPNRSICKDEIRLLDPGAGYTSYLWQDGSVNRTFAASGAGIYRVEVVDAHNCSNTASVEIDQVLPLPEKFLPNDTVMCSFDHLLIRPLKQYEAYHWSTGDVSEALDVRKAGTYTLEVTDMNNCRGTDMIVIAPKDCLKGVFIPSGFTPNQDFKNDLFKAIVHGPIGRFELTVYNRWGQKIWQTRDHRLGWDGTIAGIPQATGSFLYTCSYQFKGEPAQFLKGSVMLVR